jgi:hypothetical protein
MDCGFGFTWNRGLVRFPLGALLPETIPSMLIATIEKDLCLSDNRAGVAMMVATMLCAATPGDGPRNVGKRRPGLMCRLASPPGEPTSSTGATKSSS